MAAEGVCIVTAANSGIGVALLLHCGVACGSHNRIWVLISSSSLLFVFTGKEVAAGLLERGQHVILACRNMGRCQAVRLMHSSNFCQETAKKLCLATPEDTSLRLSYHVPPSCVCCSQRRRASPYSS